MPSLSRYRIHKNLVPSRRNTTPSFSIGLAIRHLLFEGRAECFDPLRGDGESAFARPKDTQFGRSRQGIWRPHERSTDILRAKRRKSAHSLRGNPYSLGLPK